MQLVREPITVGFQVTRTALSLPACLLAFSLGAAAGVQAQSPGSDGGLVVDLAQTLLEMRSPPSASTEDKALAMAKHYRSLTVRALQRSRATEELLLYNDLANEYLRKAGADQYSVPSVTLRALAQIRHPSSTQQLISTGTPAEILATYAAVVKLLETGTISGRQAQQVAVLGRASVNLVRAAQGNLQHPETCAGDVFPWGMNQFVVSQSAPKLTDLETTPLFVSISEFSCPDASGLPQYGVMVTKKGLYNHLWSARPAAGALPETMEARYGHLLQAPKDAVMTLSESASSEDKVAMEALVDELNKLYREGQDAAAQDLLERCNTAICTRLKADRDAFAKELLSLVKASEGAAPDRPLAFLDALKADETFVDVYKYYARQEDHFGPASYLAVISAGGQSRRVRLGPAAPIEAALAHYFEDIRRPGSHLKTWQALQHVIVEPLLAALPADTRRVWFSPDSELCNLPLAALVLQRRPDLGVAVVPSARDLARMHSEILAVEGGEKALLVGDLTYASREVPSVPPLADVALSFAQAGIRVQKLSGTQAVRSKVLSSLHDAQYVYFSTHGIWHDDSSVLRERAFRNAGIALSGYGAHTDAEPSQAREPEGLLTAWDILQLDLSRTRLVVLAACESGRGAALGGEGSQGFQMAFMSAAVRTLVVALWDVPVDASTELMRRFHADLLERHLPATEALKDAQNQVRAQPRFADPVNWAAWMLVGDPGPVGGASLSPGDASRPH
jgi:CHAT domain-containing protein